MINKAAKIQPTQMSEGSSAKLLSLLALATGAAAIPQLSRADVIFVDLSTNPPVVGPGGDASFIIDTLPGIARLGFGRHTDAVNSSRWVTAGQRAGYVRLRTNASFVVVAPLGRTWNQIGGAPSTFGTVGAVNLYGHFPPSFDHQYLAFKFQDSSQGSLALYGWVDLSLSNPANGSGPDVTIFGYAFDTTGALLPTGIVPEPSPIALLALGALAFGAKGLRSWRRNRPAPVATRQDSSV